MRFAAAIQSAKEAGATAYLELGPGPVLSAMAAQCLEGEGESNAAPIATLREGRPEAQALALSLAQAHAAGARLDWDAYFQGQRPKRVPLPTYPFQRQRYWLESASTSSDPRALGQSASEHPLLGAAVSLADAGQWLLTGRISPQSHPWLKDHAVAGTVLLPGTAFLELALAAGEQVGAQTVEELTLQAPLILSEEGATQLQLSVAAPDQQGARELQIHSRPEPAEAGEPREWSTHAVGLLSEESPEAPQPQTSWPPEGAEPIAIEDLYERLAGTGLEYGPAFQGLSAAWRLGEEVYAEASLDQEQATEAERYGLHPALSDSALHALGFLAAGSAEDSACPSPGAGFLCTGPGPRSCGWCWRPGERAPPSPSTGRTVPHWQGSEPLPRARSTPPRCSAPMPPGISMRSSGSRWRCPARAGEPSSGQSRCESSPPPEPTPPRRLAPPPSRCSQPCRGGYPPVIPSGSRLALITRGAVAAKEGESPELSGAAVWGLARSAQSEHPG